MNLCVIGTGYVGLVTGAVFSDLGNDVICVDIEEAKIEKLKNGIMPIYEPGLAEMVRHNLEGERLIFTTDLKGAVEKSEVIFISVGTPPKDNGETDLSYVQKAAESIAASMNGYKIIVNKSTVPVGTGDFVSDIIMQNKKTDANFDVVSNPEFLREGSAIKDTLDPDRIVIGAPSKRVAMRFLELYATLGKPVLITDIHSAEIIKYASNAFLATKISFINSIADLCETTGANVADVAKGMGSDNRIGLSFLNAGLGFGGSCFPKDVLSLIYTGEKYDCDFDILKAVMDINNKRSKKFVDLIENRLGDLNGKILAILGLAFKPDTDDLREAKSIEIIRMLLEKGAMIKAYDPVAINNTKAVFPNITYSQSPYDAAVEAHALVIVTEWREFKSLNLEKIKGVMSSPIIFDGRNIYDPEKKARMGYKYYSIGRQVK